jgi:hypothetical protein
MDQVRRVNLATGNVTTLVNAAGAAAAGLLFPRRAAWESSGKAFVVSNQVRMRGALARFCPAPPPGAAPGCAHNGSRQLLRLMLRPHHAYCAAPH